MTLNLGIIGTGAIAPAYMTGLGHFPDDVTVVACADLDTVRAQAFADKYGLRASSIDDLLAASDVDLIINLTIPAVHAEVSLQIINAGKHAYSEKPLAINLEDGRMVMHAAEAAGVRMGCAPDTFLGAGGQTARAVIDGGAIGRPVAATATFLNIGPQPWHPNPFFYFVEGGGPMLDMGPYYLTALVNLLGPVTTVSAMTGRAFDERLAGHEALVGQKIPVTVDTHAAGTLRFASGVIATVITSFDVVSHHLPFIEIHGTEGSLSVPDPNLFKGEVKVVRQPRGEWELQAHQHREDLQRGLGVVDMARCIQTGEPHRASGALALHVLEVMLAFDTSSATGQAVTIESKVEQPAALPPNLVEANSGLE